MRPDRWSKAARRIDQRKYQAADHAKDEHTPIERVGESTEVVPGAEQCSAADGPAQGLRGFAPPGARRPEHLQAFWWFASPKSLAFIRTYGGLLWATSSTETEAEFYRRKLEDFRWSLKVRAKGVSFVAAALQEMDESLQDIDMTQSPVGRTGPVPGIPYPAGSSSSALLSNASNAETQTPGQELGMHQIYHDHPFDSVESPSPNFDILEMESASTHEYLSDVGDQNFFFQRLAQP